MIARSVLMLALSAAPVFSQDILDGSDPEAILTIAKGYGSAELATSSSGDPFIRGRMEGQRYFLFFFGCDNGSNCSSVQFNSGWDLDDGAVTLEALNEWNKTKRFGKAYLDDENDPWIEMDVNLDHGVTRQNLDDTFDWWRIALDRFNTDIIDR